MTRKVIVCVFVRGRVSVAGADRRRAGEGELLHVDAAGRIGRLQASGEAVEDTAGQRGPGAAQHPRRVSVYTPFLEFYHSIVGLE